jgi:hypothetical protein
MQLEGRAGGTPEVIAEVAAACLLLGAMVFGGGSRGAGDAVVHLLAVPVVVLAVLRWPGSGATSTQRLFLAWVFAVLALFAIQLLPMPVALIAHLPQRAGILLGLGDAGLAPRWLPLTLDLWGTVRALLAFGTFASMTLLALTLSRAARRRLLMLALLIAVPMALLGFSQAAAGARSTLRFYDYHHPIGAIGLFANRNHFADLLGLLLPFAFAFGARALSHQQRARAAAWYALAAVLLLAVALSFSRAGTALTVLAVTVSVLVLRPAATRGRHALPLLAMGLAVLGIATYAWDGIAARLAQDPLDDLRWQYVHYGLEAMRAWWLPVGSGFGSFHQVYAWFEPVNAMREVFALHAHNDLLELLIEGGVAAGGLLLALVLIVARHEWFTSTPRRAGAVTHSGRRIHMASTIACAVPLLHSFVDYPLRTLAIAVAFGLALSVLLSDATPQRAPAAA